MIEFKIYSKIEEERIEAFKKKHRESCRVVNCSGFTVGPLFQYSFTPTGIGTAVKIKCTGCGEEEDVTDVSSW